MHLRSASIGLNAQTYENVQFKLSKFWLDFIVYIQSINRSINQSTNQSITLKAVKQTAYTDSSGAEQGRHG